MLLKKCFYNAFGESLLVLNFNYPYYDNIPVLKDLYEGVFDNIVICGPQSRLTFATKHQPDIILDNGFGLFGYHCLALAMEKFPNYKGYFFGNDDMIINWWTMVDLNTNQIWHGAKKVDWRQLAFGNIIVKKWIWWEKDVGLTACQRYFKKLKALASTGSVAATIAVKTYLKNGNGSPRCGKGWSDFFYIPGKLSSQYITLSHIAYQCNLFLEIAVHNILRSLDLKENFYILNGMYLPDIGKQDFTTEGFWSTYTHQVAFIHPYKFHARNQYFSTSLLKSKVIRFKQMLTNC